MSESKPDTQDNSSQQSQSEEQQKRQSKIHRLGYKTKNQTNSSLIINDKMSSREERKIKQYVQRIEQISRQEEQAATLKRKRSKPNPPNKQAESQEAVVIAQDSAEEQIMPTQTLVLLNPQVVPQQSQQQLEEKAQTKLRLNPKLKMKEKHHIFLYLSECYDKCADSVQKLNSTATQLYSPPRSLKGENSSLLPINSDVYQETLVLTKNLKHQFQNWNDQILLLNGNEQKEFISRFIDKKYLEGVLRESRLQIYKRSTLDKQSQSNGKLTQKKY